MVQGRERKKRFEDFFLHSHCCKNKTCLIIWPGSYENIARHSTVHTESAIPCPHCSFIAKECIKLLEKNENYQNSALPNKLIVTPVL